MKLTLGTLLVLAIMLGNNTAYGAKLKCDYQKMKDLSVARDAKGKKRKGFYIDDFTKELLFATKRAGIGFQEPDWKDGNVSIWTSASMSSRGDELLPETEHDKTLNLFMEYHKHKKTFPTEDELQVPISIPADGELLIGMADGSVVTLPSITMETGETTYDTPEPHSGERFRLVYRANFTINLNTNDRAALIATEPRALRINSNMGDLDIRLSEEDRGAFQNNIRCISGGAQ
jgi:hypothetical protein